jgi:DNA-binding NarL/FixJ family response regulator
VTVSVLIADDQPLVRAGLRVIVDAEPDLHVVAEVADGTEALARSRDLDPDIVLMDIQMPRMDGLQATRRLLAAAAARPRVIVLTTFDRHEYVFEALQAGASGFLLKDTPAQDLVAGIRAVAAGDELLAPAVTRRLIQHFTASRPVALPPGYDGLTPRERDVLLLLARGLANAEIATELGIGDATIKSHVAHLLTKLDLRDRVQAVILAYETGLVRPGQ